MKATTYIETARHTLEFSHTEAYQLAGILYEVRGALPKRGHIEAKRALAALERLIHPPCGCEEIDLRAVQTEGEEAPDG